jgi:hypothetical protein
MMGQTAKTVIIKRYLTEESLASALKTLSGPRWRGTQFQLPGSRYKWDAAYRIGRKLALVDYDGDDHYRNSLRAKYDALKDREAKAAGHKVIRIPYWVQLDDATLRYYFALPGHIDQCFPHGFITTQYFPASFCELGAERFRRELRKLPRSVREAVIASIKKRAREHGARYVLPTMLRYLLAA